MSTDGKTKLCFEKILIVMLNEIQLEQILLQFLHFPEMHAKVCHEPGLQNSFTLCYTLCNSF